MVSHNSFRLLGYFYAGLCLCSSFLLLINASQLIKENYDDAIIVGVWMLVIFSTISILFDSILIAGIVMRRTKYVQYHLKFVSFIYALVLLGLFVGCIIMGVTLASQVHKTLAIVGFMALTELFCFGIMLISIFYALTVWVLNGVMDFIKYEIVRFVSSEGGELI